MRPNVPELVRGVSAALATSVIPQLPTAWSQAEVRYTLGILDTIAAEWDGAADNLVRENGALQRFATSAAALAAENDGLLPYPLQEALTDAAALPPVPDLRLSTLAERNDALWRAMIPLLELLGAGTLPAVPAATLRAEIAPVLRRYATDRMPRRR